MYRHYHSFVVIESCYSTRSIYKSKINAHNYANFYRLFICTAYICIAFGANLFASKRSLDGVKAASAREFRLCGRRLILVFIERHFCVNA